MSRPPRLRRLEDHLLRKLGALALAVPVLIGLYLVSLTRRGRASRIGAGVAAAAIIGLVVVASLPPAPSTAIPASGPPEPVAAELLDAVRTGQALGAPLVVQFSGPMDAASVAAALRIQPEAAVTLRWNAAGTDLTILPADHWQPDTLYVVTVDSKARALTGGGLKAPIRALFLTAQIGSGAVAVTRPAGTSAGIDTAFQVILDRPVAVGAVTAALRTEPAINGTVTSAGAPGVFVFTPSSPLSPNVTYRVWLEGLTDADGVAFGPIKSLVITTAAAPAVVRFRPLAGAKAVDPAAVISVRFTERMDRALTAAAFHVTVAGKDLAGKVSWAEGDTVLVFAPTSPLPYSATVGVAVDAGAASSAGVPLATAASGTLTVKAKPAPPKAPVKAPVRVSTPPSGGGGAVSGSWTSVEAYYLTLMNCNRTIGLVTSSGKCVAASGTKVAPLKLDSGISTKVSRPYAKYLAVHALCNHFYDGNPGTRLARAGYTSYRWGENIGCEGGNPNSAVLGDHLFFQNERSTNGGHWVNLMNGAYDRCGIGVWVSSGRVRLVIDFYHP